ncbi:hypothetical protein TNCV_2636461 [Trichonephila clavipes]|uniref:Uncharacterized protein n=1 Tax=Trichonephila clavipes TaxID=2585209 RepID=A0A8X6R849_TRICX|nr:hypothetical protein TNCV_2636461 [Trichonephila clavipes]
MDSGLILRNPSPNSPNVVSKRGVDEHSNQWEAIQMLLEKDLCQGMRTTTLKFQSLSPHTEICARGSRVVKVSDRGWLVTSSSPVPLKTRG